MGAAMLLTMFSCGNTKNASTTNTQDDMTTTTTNEVRTPNTTSTINQVRTQTQTTTATTPEIGDRSNGNRNLSINNTSVPMEEQTVNQADYDLQRTKQIYTDLNMTPDQITRYETAARTWRNATTTTTPQSPTTNQSRLEQQKSALKSILDVQQYQRYEEWLINNPYRN